MEKQPTYLLIITWLLFGVALPALCKTVETPRQVISLSDGNYLVVGEKRIGKKTCGFYRLFRGDGVPITGDTLRAPNGADLRLYCATETNGVVWLGGSMAQPGSIPEQGWCAYLLVKDDGLQKRFGLRLPQVQKIIAIGSQDGTALLLGAAGNKLILLSEQVNEEGRSRFEEQSNWLGWRSLSLAKWCNNEWFIVAGQDDQNQLRVAKIDGQGQVIVASPDIMYQAYLPTLPKTNSAPKYEYVILDPNAQSQTPKRKRSVDDRLEVQDLALDYDGNVVLVGIFQVEDREASAWVGRLSPDLKEVLYEDLLKAKEGCAQYEAAHALSADFYTGNWYCSVISYCHGNQRRPGLLTWVLEKGINPTGQGARYVLLSLNHQNDAKPLPYIVENAALSEECENIVGICGAEGRHIFYINRNGEVEALPIAIKPSAQAPKYMEKGQTSCVSGISFGNVRFADQKGKPANNQLDPGEEATVSVVVNKSINTGLSFSLTADVTMAAGVVIDKGKNVNLSAAQHSQVVEFKIKASANLSAGDATVMVKCSGTVVGTIRVPCSNKAPDVKKGEIIMPPCKIESDVVKGSAVIKLPKPLKNPKDLVFIIPSRGKQGSGTIKPEKDYLKFDPRIDEDTDYITYYLTYEIPIDTYNFIEGDNTLVLCIKQGDDLIPEEQVVSISFKKPVLYVYSFGVPDAKLKFPTKDSKDFADACEQMRWDAIHFAGVHVKKPYNDSATTTHKSMIEAFEQIARDHQTGNLRDVIVIFISTHGYDDMGNYKLKASDQKIVFQNLMNEIKKIKKRVIIFIDACNSGSAIIKGNGPEKAPIDLPFEVGTALFYSSQANQPSIDKCNDKYNNGAFTYALLKGMGGEADSNKDDLISLRELKTYLSTTVPMIVSACDTIQSPDCKCIFKDRPNPEECPDDIIIFSVPKK